MVGEGGHTDDVAQNELLLRLIRDYNSFELSSCGSFYAHENCLSFEQLRLSSISADLHVLLGHSFNAHICSASKVRFLLILICGAGVNMQFLSHITGGIKLQSSFVMTLAYESVHDYVPCIKSYNSHICLRPGA